MADGCKCCNCPQASPYQLVPKLIFGKVNDERTARVAELLSDFRTLQYYIAEAPVDPQHQDDYYTEGWAAMRQCSIDGQHILNCAAETRVPRVRGGPEEQAKAELQQYVLMIDLRNYPLTPFKELCSMPFRVDMKHRRFTSGNWPPNAGSDGETRFLQGEGHTQETLSN